MEGSESEAAFDAYNLNPQRFVNEVLNSVDDLIDGAFDFSLQQAAGITASGDPNTERSEELTRGVCTIRQLTQAHLDKKMETWEKYCLNRCFTIPDGFVLPKADSSSDVLLFREGLTDQELDSQLDFLRNKLALVGKKSVELQKEIHSLENQSTLSHIYPSYIADAIQLFEQNSADKMFQVIGETASKLQSRIEEVNIKRMSDNRHTWVGKIGSPSKTQHIAHDLGLFARQDDIQEAANLLKNV